jgi:hypothetical protein
VLALRLESPKWLGTRRVHWTAADDAILLKECKKNTSFKDIARMLDGPDRNAFGARFKKLRNDELEGKSKGVSLIVQWDCRERLSGARHRSLWFQAEDDILLEGFDQALSLKETAAKLPGRSKRAVESRRYMLLREK